MCETTPIDHLIPRSVLSYRPIRPGKVSQPEIPRASRLQSQTQEPQKESHPPVPPPSHRVLPFPFPALSQDQRYQLLLVGAGMLVPLLLVVLGNLGSIYLSSTWDDLHYGRPRTFQIDAFVGHEKGGMPSHFIALNLAGRVEVIELPGGDVTQVHTYLGPQLVGPGADLIPVTVSFIDVRDDHQPDMVVQFHNIQILFRNALGTFHSV